MLKAISHSDAYQVLLLQAGDEGRAPILFGDSLVRARETVLPFLIGKSFPSVYLEHPLIGDPFIDVTVLYSQIERNMRIDSEMAAGTDGLLDWYAEACDGYEEVSFGFEVDTKDPALPAAAVHFQPRKHTELVAPFCEAAGESERAGLYLGLAERMPQTWPLSFFGMFRGRPGSPLRVCGYLGADEVSACANDARHIAQRFDEIGFTAYDDDMLVQVTQLMGAAPETVDFQFDVYPDGSLGDIFAIDVQFNIEQPEAVCASFEGGPASRVMGLLEQWGIADKRWKLGGEAAFARSLPVELDDGSAGRYAFTLMPQWVKARWSSTMLQPSKLYHLCMGSLLD